MMADLKLTRTVTVDNREGLHARPVLLIARLAVQYADADLAIVKGSQSAPASNMIDMLGLGAKQGHSLVLEASGPRAQEALDALEQLFARKFDEE
jgi:phosphotransferase system HPr (HPr) family protein